MLIASCFAFWYVRRIDEVVSNINVLWLTLIVIVGIGSAGVTLNAVIDAYREYKKKAKENTW